jgi:hypothetical protein
MPFLLLLTSMGPVLQIKVRGSNLKKIFFGSVKTEERLAGYAGAGRSIAANEPFVRPPEPTPFPYPLLTDRFTLKNSCSCRTEGKLDRRDCSACIYSYLLPTFTLLAAAVQLWHRITPLPLRIAVQGKTPSLIP